VCARVRRRVARAPARARAACWLAWRRRVACGHATTHAISLPSITSTTAWSSQRYGAFSFSISRLSLVIGYFASIEYGSLERLSRNVIEDRVSYDRDKVQTLEQQKRFASIERGIPLILSRSL
jgi:hypothetical protein